ncbi:hypothetical protein [Paenibacillus sp. 1P07SE]|uniref:hypothetical protein n=1 Tax=Paenibacillus sp. 1P07SE TaxID=3132209 RepID=UPI0039A4FE58
MKHQSEAFWRQYAFSSELSPQEREEAENHLYSCEDCLAQYMRVLEEAEAVADLSEQGATALLIRVREHQEVQWAGRRRRRRSTSRERRSALIHYVIAASLTLFFFSSGVLQDYLADTAPRGEEQLAGEKQPTITERLMERTTRILDEWMASREPGSEG